MSLDSLLIEILVDPEDKQSLWYIEDEAILYNPRLHRSYTIRDGIPVMLIDEATAIDADEVKRIESIADRVETGHPSSSS